MPFRVDRLPSLRGSNARPCILGLDPNQRCNPIGSYLFHLIPLNPRECPSAMCRGVQVRALCWSGPLRRVGWLWRPVCSLPPLRCFGLLPVVCVPFFFPSCLSGLTGLRPCGCVCVWHLNRCKTSAIFPFYLAGGHRGPGGVSDQRRHLPGTAGHPWRTWAHLSRSWWPP